MDLQKKPQLKPEAAPGGERAYLDMLCGPNGEGIKYKRLGSCCAFESPSAPFYNTGLLDIYEVTYEGLDEPVKVYLNMYVPSTRLKNSGRRYEVYLYYPELRNTPEHYLPESESAILTHSSVHISRYCCL